MTLRLSEDSQQPHADQVDDESDRRDDKHRPALDLGWCLEPLVRFVKDVDRQQQQHDRVGERGQHLHPQIAVRPLRCRFALRETDCEQRERQPGDIGHHVGRVRQQSQAACDQTADDLRRHVRRRQAERPRQPSRVLRGRGSGGTSTVHIFNSPGLRLIATKPAR